MRPSETIYRGERFAVSQDGFIATRVTVDDKPLTLRGAKSRFEWGYSGLGPSHLAFALILDATGDRALAEKVHRWFRWAVITNWGQRWTITAGEIRAWIERWQREDRSRERADDPIEIVAEKGGAS